jgi:uncharacterized lipoprotein YbaY
MPLAFPKMTLAALAVALGTVGCASAPPANPDEPAITGRAHYRARILMPAAAVFEATVEDVSRADAPAVVIGQVRMTRLDPPPFRFRIPYDPAKVVPGHRYVVRARITLDEVTRFRTVTAVPVLGSDGLKQVELQLEGEGGSFKPLPGT